MIFFTLVGELTMLFPISEQSPLGVSISQERAFIVMLTIEELESLKERVKEYYTLHCLEY